MCFIFLATPLAIYGRDKVLSCESPLSLSLLTIFRRPLSFSLSDSLHADSFGNVDLGGLIGRYYARVGW